MNKGNNSNNIYYVDIYIIIIIIIIISEQFIKRRKLWIWLPHQGRFDIFNDDQQRVQQTLSELPPPYYICMYSCYQLHPSSPSRHYYPRLIAGTNLLTPEGWIAWFAKADCTQIPLPKVIIQLNSKAPEGNELRLSDPRQT